MRRKGKGKGREAPEIALVKTRFTDARSHPETAFSGSKAKLLEGFKGKAKEKALNWLRQQEAFVITRPAPSGNGKFPRQKIKTGGVDYCWELDLADMGSNKDMLAQNDQHRYVLVVVDQFSRYCMAEALKQKDGKTVAQAFERILARARTAPLKVSTDGGKEFYNTHFKAVLQNKGILGHYTPQDNEIKCPIVERLNRSLKQMTTTYFIQNSTPRWVDMLPALVKSYNHTRHSSLGTSPIQVLHSQGKELEAQWQRQYDMPLKPKQMKTVARDLKAFKRGDLVRIATQKSRFEKGYTPRWRREPMRVARVIYRYPRVAYKLVDLQNDPLDRIFYYEQLQKHLGRPEVGRVIEEVVDHDERRGKVTVKFLGWPPKFNQTMPIDKYNQLVRQQNNRYGLNLNPPPHYDPEKGLQTAATAGAVAVPNTTQDDARRQFQ